MRPVIGSHLQSVDKLTLHALRTRIVVLQVLFHASTVPNGEMMITRLFISAVAARYALAQSDIPPLAPLQQVLTSAQSNPLYHYPTDFTQGILPKAIHSHNDYWRPVPFYSALSQGVISVEADVWLYNGTLHVGHEESALTAERTFDSLYVQPILQTLKRQNPSSPYLTEPTTNGVFDTDGSQTLYLYVDMKTDGALTFPYVVTALEPLRSAGYLTTFDGKSVQSGVVSVIGTG